MELFKYLAKMNRWFAYGIGVANVVSSIFSGNKRLCENLPADLLYTFADVLQANRRPGGTGFLPHQLAFVQAGVVVGQRPILKNKMVVLDILKSPVYDKILHLMTSDADRPRRRELAANFKSMKELAKPQMFRMWVGGDAEIQYHNRTIELLAMLCLGRDASGSTAFVQSQVPGLALAAEYMEVDEVQKGGNGGGAQSVDVVSICRAMKSNLLMLLEYAYYNTNLKDDLFTASLLHVRVLESSHASLKRMEPSIEQGDMSKLDEAFLLRVLKTVLGYLEFGSRNKESPEVQPTIENLFKPTFEKLHAGPGGVPRKNEVYRAAVSRSLGFIIDSPHLKAQRLVDDDRRSSITAGDSIVYNTSFRHCIAKISEEAGILDAIHADHDSLVQHFIDISSHTNVTDVVYQRELKAAEKASRELNRVRTSAGTN
jgi:hypothetical protein